MGRIKIKSIKNAGKSLVLGEHSFTSNFETNKKLLKDTIPSTQVRNKVAGYITRHVKMQEAEKS